MVLRGGIPLPIILAQREHPEHEQGGTTDPTTDGDSDEVPIHFKVLLAKAALANAQALRERYEAMDRDLENEITSKLGAQHASVLDGSWRSWDEAEWTRQLPPGDTAFPAPADLDRPGCRGSAAPGPDEGHIDDTSLPEGISSAAQWARTVICFGKLHKGETYDSVFTAPANKSYINWVLDNGSHASPALYDFYRYVLFRNSVGDPERSLIPGTNTVRILAPVTEVD